MPAQTIPEAPVRGVPLDRLPKKSEIIDLDARRAARMEATGPKTIRHGGKEWEFRPEMPMQVVENFTAGDMVGAFSRLLVDPDLATEFLAAGDLTQNDFKELMTAVYELNLGN